MNLAPSGARREEEPLLPTLATHGCTPEHHRSQTKYGLVMTEECTQCGYRISYGPAGLDRLLPTPCSFPVPCGKETATPRSTEATQASFDTRQHLTEER
ncbi:hypothetical protein GKJPGBOP_01562 [Streptomyces paromomycinus]|uniref:Uncharacterized protein n=1 Tax=Streptomyces paromomycinus TaxID=92743 RepID=A0A401VXU7_STREY|nr:hypothetical protein GKJPGBOP_01562 [Streptomyces paromomycinus]